LTFSLILDIIVENYQITKESPMITQEEILKKFSQYPIMRGSYFETRHENGKGKICFVGNVKNIKVSGNSMFFTVQKISHFKDGELVELTPPGCCFEGKIENVRDLDFSYRLSPDDDFGRERKLFLSLTVDLADDPVSNTHDRTVYFFPNIINYGPVSKSTIVLIA
jgi:hypothetical protein